MTILQKKATEQYFPVVLFIMLYKVILNFDCVDEILKCEHSNESYWAVLSCGAVYYAVQLSSYFWACGWNPKVWPFKWKPLSSTMLFRMVITFESVDETNIQVTAIEHYFSVALFVMRQDLVQTLESVNDISLAKCNQADDIYREVFSKVEMGRTKQKTCFFNYVYPLSLMTYIDFSRDLNSNFTANTKTGVWQITKD